MDTISGIDISKWQPNSKFDWKVLTNNTSFVYMKATEGVGFKDSTYLAKTEQCKRFKIPYGYYHFARPSLESGSVRADAIAEAEYFLEIASPQNPMLPYVMDIEVNNRNLSKAQIEEWCLAFYDKVTESGNKCLLYTYPSFADSNFPTNHKLGHMPLWIAHYTAASQPRLPRGWNEYLIWQYTDSGTVLGYDGKLDVNRAKPELLTCR